MPIELILKGIDYVLKLLERREKVAQDRFEKIYTPIFQDLTVINQNYIEMFSQVRELFPLPIESKMPDYRARMSHACDTLRTMRIQFASVREKTSAFAAALHSAAGLSQVEVAFVNALILYMPSGELHVPVAADTPDKTKATVLLDDLYRNLDSPNFNARARLDETIATNHVQWKGVCLAYSTLSLATIR